MHLLSSYVSMEVDIFHQFVSYDDLQTRQVLIPYASFKSKRCVYDY